ncbi:redoxin domain-containing protein [Paractinoplanes rhizophilus]|jgi:thiol-disulfide isomerase/thioredoxin|uniref:Redoxin domain-containing protein n=1 Tax=Paractinoplanes rhizophilus TaxID=1416877 RepID=A0ABW2HST9_9ACTN
MITVAMASGCAAKAEAPDSAPITPASLPAGTVAAVPATLRFSGKTLDGARFDAATMAGKPAILWFWAPWCATCASEAQSISDLAQEYRGRLGILGIAGLGDNKAMHEFVSDLNVGAVPHLDDRAGAIWKRFKITQQSTYVFLDAGGKVLKTGYLDDLQLTEQVRSMVA